VLANPLVSGRVANTMAAREVSSLKAFMEMMAKDSARAFYGPGHVFAANEIGRLSVYLCVFLCYICVCVHYSAHDCRVSQNFCQSGLCLTFKL